MSSEQSQVIVAYDFSQSAGSAMSRAIALAARAPFHVLHFVCILDPHRGVAALATKHVDLSYADRVREEIAKTVELALRAANTKQALHFHVHVRIAGNAAKEILEVASEVGADLIVIGSVSERIVREARCAVVIARPKEYPYVVHEDVVEVEAAHPCHKSFHFSYDDHIGIAEPMRWPGA
jgi:nucleotide-binding universal stress UspA family protein